MTLHGHLSPLVHYFQNVLIYKKLIYFFSWETRLGFILLSFPTI